MLIGSNRKGYLKRLETNKQLVLNENQENVNKTNKIIYSLLYIIYGLSC